MSKNNLKEELKTLINNSDDYSYSSISRSIGISTSALHQYVNGVYKGNSERIEKAVKAFITRERLRQQKHDISFVPTSISENVFDIARMSHIYNEIGLCCGDAGVGKTFAIREYSAQNSDVILVEIDPGYTPKTLFVELHKKLGFDGIGTIYKMMQDIIDKLKNSNRLIIIDEAEHLSYKSLELIRRIHDKANIGILLVGMQRLISNLRGARGDYAQLYSRVGMVKVLSRLEPEDTEDIVSNILMEKGDIYKTFHQKSRGNTRVLSKLILRAIRASQINNCAIDKDLVNEVSEMLIV